MTFREKINTNYYHNKDDSEFRTDLFKELNIENNEKRDLLYSCV